MTHPRPPFLYGLLLALALATALCYWPHPVDPAVTAAQGWLAALKAQHAGLKRMRDSADRLHQDASRRAQDDLRRTNALLSDSSVLARRLATATSARDSLPIVVAQRDSADTLLVAQAKAYQILEAAYGLAQARGDSLQAALAAGSQHLGAVLAVKTKRCGLKWVVGAAGNWTGVRLPVFAIGGGCDL